MNKGKKKCMSPFLKCVYSQNKASAKQKKVCRPLTFYHEKRGAFYVLGQVICPNCGDAKIFRISEYMFDKRPLIL